MIIMACLVERSDELIIIGLCPEYEAIEPENFELMWPRRPEPASKCYGNWAFYPTNFVPRPHIL